MHNTTHLEHSPPMKNLLNSQGVTARTLLFAAESLEDEDGLLHYLAGGRLSHGRFLTGLSSPVIAPLAGDGANMFDILRHECSFLGTARPCRTCERVVLLHNPSAKASDRHVAKMKSRFKKHEWILFLFPPQIVKPACKSRTGHLMR